MTTLGPLIDAFTADDTVRLIAALILVDIVVGVAAAFYTKRFTFAWLSAFLRDDVLGKVIPYFGVWAGVRIGGDIEVAGFGAIEETVGGMVVLTLATSVVNSLRDLGLLRGLPTIFAGSDRVPPGP